MCSCGSGFELANNGLDCDGMALSLEGGRAGEGGGEKKSKGSGEDKTSLPDAQNTILSCK